MSDEPLTRKEIEILRGMMDEYEFAHRRRLLWSQRWHGVSGSFLYALRFALYAAQLVVAILALYALSHH